MVFPRPESIQSPRGCHKKVRLWAMEIVVRLLSTFCCRASRVSWWTVAWGMLGIYPVIYCIYNNSWNVVTQKWMVYMEKPSRNRWFGATPISGNHHFRASPRIRPSCHGPQRPQTGTSWNRVDRLIQELWRTMADLHFQWKFRTSHFLKWILSR